MDKEQALAIARTVLHEEANAVLSVAKELTDDFYKALDLFRHRQVGTYCQQVGGDFRVNGYAFFLRACCGSGTR